MSDFETRLSSALRNLSEQAPSAVGLEEASRARYHHRRRRTRMGVVAVGAAASVLALPLTGSLLAGGPAGTSSGGPAATSSATETVWPNSLQPAQRATVGERLVSDLGAITVHELQFPVAAPPGVTPPSGKDFGVLDLEVCSNGRSVGDAGRYHANDFNLIEVWVGSGSVGPKYWHLGENRVRVDTELRTPTLTDAQLADVADGDCERGWVTFTLPRGAEIGSVSYMPFGTILRSWRTLP